MRRFPALLAFALCLTGLPLAAHAQDEDDANAPPALDADPPPAGASTVGAASEDPNGPTPADSATADVHTKVGDAEATLSLLNPHQAAAPLWLWVKGSGPASSEVRITDPEDRVLWRAGLQGLRERGELVVVPRPNSLLTNAVRLVVVNGPGAPKSRELTLFHQKLAQLSLPILVVGGNKALALADKLRARAPDRVIHVIPGSALPRTPAAFLGVTAVVVAQDAQLPAPQANALRLFHCARGGVSTLMPISLPPHLGCMDPPVLVGDNGGPPTADGLLRSLRDLQVTLGLLEERGSPGVFGNTVTDGQAAAALLLSRPPAQAGVLLLLAALLCMGGAIYVIRRFSPVNATITLGLVPLGCAVLVALVGAAFGGGPAAVKLVTVDVKQGAAVALVRTVEVSRGRPAVTTSPTAWVTALAPPEASIKSQLQVVESVDVMDVPNPMTAVPDPANPQQMAIKVGTSDATPAYACRDGGTIKAGGKVTTAHGKMLLDRCLNQPGAVGPLNTAWVPATAALLDGAADGSSGWVHVFGGAP
jgi:hypothetical protein